MIPKRVIDAYLAQPRTSWVHYKRFSKKKLRREMELLPVRPPIWSRLRHDQRVCLVLGAQQQRFCFWNDTGTGKSLLSIALIRYFRAEWARRQPQALQRRALVIVPNKVNKGEWAREIRKHSPSTKFCVLRGTSSQKWDKLRATKAPIVIETAAGFVRMCCDRVPIMRRFKGKLIPKKKKGKVVIKLKPIKAKVQELQGIIGSLYLDESEYVARVKSLMHRICRKLSDSADQVFLLNGTPFGRDPTPVWGQMFIADKGESLGRTLGLFREVFFQEVETPWGRPDLVFRHRKSKLLHSFIAHRSISIEIDEADLPTRVPIEKEFRLSAAARAYYDQALDALRAAQVNKQQRKNEFMRLRQLSSGWLGYHDDEEGKRAQLEFPENPKLDITKAIVSEVHRKHKVLIFHEFNFSGAMLCRELTELDVPHVRLYGGTKDPEDVLKQFTDDSKTRVFVINSRAGGKGLNLQVARYAIYFESPTSAIVRKQTERRIVRQYSEHSKVVIYDPVMKNGVDKRILEFHKQGNDLLEAVLHGRARL